MRRFGLASMISCRITATAARLAGARAAEEGEMLAQHVVDLDVGADRAVLLQVPDVDRVGAGRVVDGAQAVAAERVDPVAHHGILGDAALKADGRLVGA